MERVLTYSNLIADTWDRQINPSDLPLSSGGIDSERIRKLSHVVERVNRSIWVDIVTLLVAILIGIGVGFAVLKFAAPHLLGRGGNTLKGFDVVSSFEEP